MGERTLEHVLRPRTAGTGLDVFAIEPSSAQITWSRLDPATTSMRLDDRQLAVDQESWGHPGGPGAVVVDGLEPDTSHTISLRTSSGDIVRRRFRTLASPPGDELFRFATISDLHLGRGNRSYRGPLASRTAPAKPEGDGATDHATAAQARPRPLKDRSVELDPQFRSARAAIDEALAWGAQMLVVKGDVCEETVDWVWDRVAMLLGDLPIPVAIIPGNHDTGSLRHFEPEHGAAARGLHLTRGVDHFDVPGLRIVLVDSTRPGNGWGSVDRHADEVADLASDASDGVFIATHHHPQRFVLPLFWPHGIPGTDATRFAHSVGAANPSVLASSGHTHRCRRRRVGPLEWTEVAATNHFPGVWAGYAVHEGGIRQVVRRIAEPEPISWIEDTRHMLGGVWALWSTGTMSDRCFSITW